MRYIKIIFTAILIGLMFSMVLSTAIGDFYQTEEIKFFSDKNVNNYNGDTSTLINIDINDRPRQESYGTPQPLNTNWQMFRSNPEHSANSTSTIPGNNSIFWQVTGAESSSPAISNGRVFFGAENNISCYLENSGTFVWSYPLSGAGGYGVIPSPAVYDDKVIAGDSNNIHCFWASNGSYIWGDNPGSHYTSPTVANGMVYCGASNGNLYCRWASNGTETWSVNVGSTYSSPAVANNKVFVGSSSGAAYINCLYTSNGTIIWQYNIGGQIHSSPSVVNGYVYVGSTNGYLYCLDEDGFTDGNQGWTGEGNVGPGYGDVIWSYNVGGQIWGSPAISDGRLYIGSTSTNFNLYSFWASNGTYIWDTNLANHLYSSPAVADGKVVVNGDGGMVYCLNQYNGSIIWFYNIIGGSDMYSSPAIANGRVFANSGGGFFCFGVEDTVLPTIQSVQPVDDAINVSINTNITIIFNETMNPTTTEPAFSITPNVIGAISWPDSQTMTFDPTNPLAGETQYTVKIAASATDFSANNLDGNGNGIADAPSTLDDYIWNFTTHEDILPKVIAISPARDAENVSLNTNISITFSELMNQTSVEQAFTISPYISGTYDWFDKNFTFQPDVLLIEDTLYSIRLNSTCTDLVGNRFDGNKNTIFDGSPDDDYYWSFKTRETKPPFITSVTPVNLAQDVLINVDIQVIFNEPMNKSSVESGFSISPEVSGIVVWSGVDTILTFSPVTTFNGSTLYTVNITTEAKDKVGNTLDGNMNGTAEGSPLDDYSWSFTTALIPDEEPPIVLNTLPTDGATEVNKSTSIKVYFNEPMNQGMTETGFSLIPYIDGIFTWDTSGQVMTFTPANDLKYDTEYSIKLIGNTVRDLASNTLDGNNNTISDGSPSDDYSWSFITEPEPVVEIIYPTIISVLPHDGAMNIAIDSNIEVFFSKNMNMASTQFAFSISPAVTGTFDWDLTKMIYNPTTDLAYETTYTMILTTDATDIDNNPLDGNNNSVSEGSPYDDYVWTFTTTQGSDQEKYNLSISGTTIITIKLNENRTYPITITNLGALDDRVHPGLNAGSISNFVTISDTSPRPVGAGNSWAINLNLAIPMSAVPGTYNITFEATSEYGEFTRYHKIEVTIMPFEELEDPDHKDTDGDELASMIIFDIIIVVIIVIIALILMLIFIKKRKREQHPNQPGPEVSLPPQQTAVGPDYYSAPPGAPQAGQPLEYISPPPEFVQTTGPEPPQQPYSSQSTPVPPVAIPVSPPPVSAPPEPLSWDEE
jgi:outer membrane protein assembly factor BamB